MNNPSASPEVKPSETPQRKADCPEPSCSPLLLPVDTTRGIAYASIPRGMSERYYDHLIQTLEFHAEHHPEFIHRPAPSDYQI